MTFSFVRFAFACLRGASRHIYNAIAHAPTSLLCLSGAKRPVVISPHRRNDAAPLTRAGPGANVRRDVPQ